MTSEYRKQRILQNYGPQTYRYLRNLLRALDGETNTLEEHKARGKALLMEINLSIQEDSSHG